MVFVYFLFPETANRSLEELAFREYHSIQTAVWFLMRLRTVYEGDKVRAEQQKRVEEDMLTLENRAPIPEQACDKESAFHVEIAKI